MRVPEENALTDLEEITSVLKYLVDYDAATDKEKAELQAEVHAALATLERSNRRAKRLGLPTSEQKVFDYIEEQIRPVEDEDGNTIYGSVFSIIPRA